MIREVVGLVKALIPKRRPLEERLRCRELKLASKLSRKQAKRRAKEERKQRRRERRKRLDGG